MAAKIFSLLKADLNEIFHDTLNKNNHAEFKCKRPCCCELKEVEFRLEKIKYTNSLESSMLGANYDESKNVGFWEFNVSTLDFYWSAKMYEVYGLPAKEKFDHADFVKQIHPEDIDMINFDLERLIKNNVIYDNTHRVIFNDGEVKVRGVASKYLNEAGDIIIFGIAERAV